MILLRSPISVGTTSEKTMNTQSTSSTNMEWRSAELYLRGIKPRARKPDMHIVSLGAFGIHTVPADVRDLVREKVGEFKSVTWAKLQLERWSKNEEGNSTRILMDPQDIKVDALELIK